MPIGWLMNIAWVRISVWTDLSAEPYHASRANDAKTQRVLLLKSNVAVLGLPIVPVVTGNVPPIHTWLATWPAGVWHDVILPGGIGIGASSYSVVGRRRLERVRANPPLANARPSLERRVKEKEDT